MTSIVVRGLDETVKKRLAEQAKEHGRSPPNIGLALMHMAQGLGGVDELDIPGRNDRARAVDFE